MKKIVTLALLCSLFSLTSCEDLFETSSTNACVSGDSSTTPEVDPFIYFLAELDEGFSATGEFTETVTYDNAYFTEYNYERTYSYTTISDATSYYGLTTSGEDTYREDTYFKTDKGYLATEAYSYDNTVILEPVVNTSGEYAYFDKDYANVFASNYLLSSFTQNEDGTFTLTGRDALTFLSFTTDLVYEEVSLTFTYDEDTNTATYTGTGTGADYYLSTSTYVSRSLALAISGTLTTDVSGIPHLSVVEEQTANSNLKAVLSKISNDKYTITHHQDIDSKTEGTAVYFNGSEILLQYTRGLTEPGMMDCYFAPDSDGLLQMQLYFGFWMTNDYSATEMYPTAMTYAQMAKTVSKLSADLFTTTDGYTYTLLPSASKSFVSQMMPMVADHAGLTDYQMFQYAGTGLTITVSEDLESFDCVFYSSYSLDNGNTVNTSANVYYDNLGTGTFPYTIE